MGINWGILKEQGRVKDINMPWSDEELKALNVYKIPADLVRKGVVTPEEHQAEVEAPKDETKLLRQMSKDELKRLAQDLGLVFPDDIQRLKIISLIKNSKLPVQPKDQESLES